MGLKLELIQVCVIDFFSGRILLCSVVEPPTPLLHLNTKYSGVTASFFAGAVREGDVISSRRDVREKIWEYVDDQTVIVGHDLRNDFEKLRIIHEMVLDTSLLTMEFGNRRGLATLAREIGGLEIRKGDGEHCVSEDTMATRQVAIKLIEEKSGLVAGVGLENWW